MSGQGEGKGEVKGRRHNRDRPITCIFDTCWIGSIVGLQSIAFMVQMTDQRALLAWHMFSVCVCVCVCMCDKVGSGCIDKGG